MLSVIIPCYNEEKTIAVILEKVLYAPCRLKKELVIVNDASTDATDKEIRAFINKHKNQKILYTIHKKNKGKGAAIRTGIQRATGEYTIIQDADLEYDPSEYDMLLKPMLDGFADVVYGSRFISGNPHRISFFWHTQGNKFLTFLSNITTNLNLTDMETCYKCFRTNIIKSIKLKEDRFGFEPEVTAKIARVKKIRIYEVGISYYGRTYDEGKKIGWKDGVRAIYVIFKYWL